MIHATKLAWTFLLLAGVAAVLIESNSYLRARAAADSEVSRARMVATQARQLAMVQPVTHSWAARRRPESGLAARLGETLAACGIAAQALSNVSPQSEIPLSGTDAQDRLRRQRAGFTLVSVTLPQVGSFLEAWRAREPHWGVAGIDLTPEPSDIKAAGGSDLPLRAVITLEAVYLDQKGADR